MKIPREARKLSRELFNASFSGGRLDPQKVRRLVAKVAEEKPRHYLDVLKAYQRLVRIEVQKHQALVESAVPLDPAIAQQISADLQRKYGSLEIEHRVNPGLIGGLRVRIGHDVWDGSVRSRLDRLEQQLSHA